MQTLIIVDAQNDFMPGGALEVADGNRIVPVINQIQSKFNLVIATQDWHPEDHGSFFTHHAGKNPFDKTTLNGLEQILWPPHCIQNSSGADFHPELQTNLIEAIFRKGMDKGIDSYSGFYDNGKKKSTGLAGYLREKGASVLFFSGLAADICVYFTLKDAVKEGFKSVLIEDATKPLDADNFEEIKKELKSMNVQIIQSADI